MLEPSECPHGTDFGANGKKWIEKPCGEIEGEEHRGELRKVTGDGGGEKVERGLKDERRRNIDMTGGSSRSRVESKKDVTRRLRAVETEGAIKRQAESKCNQWEKWPFSLNSISVEDVKTTRRTCHRRLHVFLWFTILLFSLCPNMASSQVRK